jgi:hypothetical protein
MTIIILSVLAIPTLFIGSMIFRACKQIYKEDLASDLLKANQQIKEKKLYRGNKDYLRKLN